mgnify:CR=1 FL=1
MLLQTVRPNIVQAIRAYRVEDLMAAARDQQLRQFLESDGERSTPAPDIETLRRRLRLVELSA